MASLQLDSVDSTVPNYFYFIFVIFIIADI